MEERKLLQTNIGLFRQIFSNRANYAINNSVYRYEVGLRTEPNKIISKSLGKKDNEDKKNALKTIPWNSTTIPKERSLLDKLLPPVLQPSKEVFSKFENKVGRPIIQIKKDDPKYEEYLKQYQHDLEIMKMQKDILGKK